MEGADPSILKPRPRVLRQRSHSAVTKTTRAPDTTAADSDASKRSSRHGHRHTQSHHHIPHHPRRFVKDRLGQLQNGGVPSLAELSKTTSRISNAPREPGSAEGSRKASKVEGYNLDGAAGSTLGLGVPVGADAEEVDKLVLEEQWKNLKRQGELQHVLHGLSDESMKTTRRLDDLYYSLLERLAGLRVTIGNLQELAGLTAALHEQFREETGELTTDLMRQLEGFGGFKAQQVKIDAIDGRVKESKEKADKLSERMEGARERVSALEIREQEWQDSVNWRLRWMWTILGIIGGLLVMLCFMHVTGVNPTAQSPNLETMNSSLTSLTAVPTSVKSVLEDVMGHSIRTSKGILSSSTPSGIASMSSRISKILEPTTPADQDPLLRIFDEL